MTSPAPIHPSPTGSPSLFWKILPLDKARVLSSDVILTSKTVKETGISIALKEENWDQKSIFLDKGWGNGSEKFHSSSK